VTALRSEGDVEADYQKKIESGISLHIAPVVGRQGMSVAILTGICAAAGGHVDAAKLAERWAEVADADARIQTLLWGAHACSSLDRFTRAREFAHQGRQEARSFGSKTALGRCAIASTYAQTSNLWLRVVPGEPFDIRFMIRSLAALVVVVWTAVRWAPLARRLIRSLRPGTESDLTAVRTSDFRFCADYLEHLIRLTTFPDRLSRRVGILRPLVRRSWSVLSSNCGSIGYTWGVFNVSRYTSRTSGEFEAPHGVITTAGVMGDRLGTCIAYRDAAIYLTDHSDLSTDLGLHRQRAQHYLAQSIDQAAQLGCPSLVLKALVAQRRLEPNDRLPHDVVAEELKAVECEGISRQAKQIIATLCD